MKNWLEENCVCRSDPTTKWEQVEEEEESLKGKSRVGCYFWVNRAFCGKSMKLGTDVHHTKPSKFSYSAKPDFPRGGFGSHLKNGRYAPYLRN